MKTALEAKNPGSPGQYILSYTNSSSLLQVDKEDIPSSSNVQLSRDTSGTLNLMKLMRDQMASFNTKELKLFDEIIKQLAEEQELAGKRQNTRFSRQEMTIFKLNN